MGHKKKTRYTRPSRREIREFRKFLGAIADQYNDAQIAQLRWEMHEWAVLLLDLWLQRQKE